MQIRARRAITGLVLLALAGCSSGGGFNSPAGGTKLIYGTITTFAGTGTYGSTGDGGPATSARIYQPYAVTFDSSGSLYIADAAEEVVRKVDGTTNIISTFAGIAGVLTHGYSGNGGIATRATLCGPFGLVADQKSNLYISDECNNVVRVVSSESGVISAYAGNAVLASTPNGTYSGDGGPATAAGINHAFKIIFDKSGNLYIADTYNSTIRRVDQATQTISTVAGTIPGTSSNPFGGDGGLATRAQLNRPTGIALDAAGNLYIADFATNTVRQVNAGTGIITTFAGGFVAGQPGSYSGDGGPAAQAKLNGPTDVAFDGDGNLLIADTSNNVIRRVTMSTGIIDTIVGTTQGYAGDGGPAKSAKINNPYGMAFDAAGNLYIADSANGAIRKVSTSR